MESEDAVALAEPIQFFTEEENFGVEIEKKRAETQKLPNELYTLIQITADTKLDETIRELKSIRDVSNVNC